MRPENRKEGRNDRRLKANLSAERRVVIVMRLQMKRFTRLSNAFTKKFENHAHMVALYMVWYNFVKMHKKHRMSPAMAAGVSDQLWSMEDAAMLVEAAAPAIGKRCPDKKRD
ncbi:hypothetical protein CFIICLFH_4420 [Methylobacterium goesingense]|uniref:Transposase n=1 Tax=Methylobacterium goesingense TaxID=243690 RepID=A0ABV2L9P5_9HYPH|nr:hypothetical protein CFIICLFH_4420 [Methylobacterium goesingense]